MGNIFELMQIQPFMPCGSIEMLDVGILGELAAPFNNLIRHTNYPLRGQ